MSAVNTKGAVIIGDSTVYKKSGQVFLFLVLLATIGRKFIFLLVYDRTMQFLID